MDLSIITVHFNEVDQLGNTFESIKKFRNLCNILTLEWIVIDGGTSLILPEIPKMKAISSYADYYTSESDKGIYDAMNKGVACANGAYCIFMNAGDCFSDRINLSLLESIIPKSDVGVLYGNSCEIDKFGNRHNKISRHIDKIWYGMVTHHQAMIFKTKLLKMDKYQVSYLIGADYALTSDLYMKGESFIYCDTYICDFQLTGISSTQYFRGLKDQYFIRKKILCIPFPMNLSIYFLKSIARIFRLGLPSAYKELRYK